MFDKIYRQTMDDIPLNYALLADLKKQAEQIDKTPVVMDKKKPVFNVYRYGFAVAVLVVAVLGANIFSSYMSTKDIIKTETENYIEADTTTSAESAETGKTTGQQTQNAAITEDSQASNTAGENVSAQNIVSHSADASSGRRADTQKQADGAAAEYSLNQNTPAKAEEKPVQKDAVTVAQTEKVAPLSDETNTEAVMADDSIIASEESEEAFDLAAETESSPLSGGSSGGGGGGSSSGAGMPASGAERTMSAGGYEQWSIERYCAYFGFDISGIVLPDGLKNSMTASCRIYREENGDIANAQGTVFYSKGDKTVAITLYTDADYVKSVAAGREKISSSAWVKRYENGAFTVYAASQNCGYVAEVSGFSETEMTAFANSLK